MFGHNPPIGDSSAHGMKPGQYIPNRPNKDVNRAGVEVNKERFATVISSTWAHINR